MTLAKSWTGNEVARTCTNTPIWDMASASCGLTQCTTTLTQNEGLNQGFIQIFPKCLWFIDCGEGPMAAKDSNHFMNIFQRPRLPKCLLWVTPEKVLTQLSIAGPRFNILFSHFLLTLYGQVNIYNSPKTSSQFSFFLSNVVYLWLPGCPPLSLTPASSSLGFLSPWPWNVGNPRVQWLFIKCYNLK